MDLRLQTRFLRHSSGAVVEGRQCSKVGLTSLRMAEIIASNGPVSPIRPGASIHPRPEHGRGSCDIYVDPDPKT
jgi:hypothetical protein